MGISYGFENCSQAPNRQNIGMMLFCVDESEEPSLSCWVMGVGNILLWGPHKILPLTHFIWVLDYFTMNLKNDGAHSYDLLMTKSFHVLGCDH